MKNRHVFENELRDVSVFCDWRGRMQNYTMMPRRFGMVTFLGVSLGALPMVLW